jgi:hypothetical protein
MAENIALCTYRVKSGRESEFESLLHRHFPTLRRLGLVNEAPHLILRGREGGGPVFVEVLPWKDAGSADLAEQTPEVMAIWERLGALVEDRGGRPGMEFPHMESLPEADAQAPR